LIFNAFIPEIPNSIRTGRRQPITIRLRIGYTSKVACALYSYQSLNQTLKRLITGNKQISAVLSGCRNNDRSSQKELYQLLKGYAMKICYRYQQHTEQVEEIVNEGFTKLFKNIHQFDENRHQDISIALKGWFKRILINTCIDYYRKNASYINGQVLSEETEKIADRTENGLDMLSYKEIIEAIRELSPAYRTVFNLFVIEGMTHEEIGNQLGISVGASKSNLSKARENLRKILTKKTEHKIYVEPFR
jgi:RNA polymerase sigma-70 factor (ECF subfamily)